MTKDEAVKWMVEKGLAENEFSAGHIYSDNGLNLEGRDTDEQKSLVIRYREWRKISKNTKLCYAYTLQGLFLPKGYDADIS